MRRTPAHPWKAARRAPLNSPSAGRIPQPVRCQKFVDFYKRVARCRRHFVKPETPLRGVRTNIVQSIRAFRVRDLQDAATAINHFLYANWPTRSPSGMCST